MTKRALVFAIFDVPDDGILFADGVRNITHTVVEISKEELKLPPRELMDRAPFPMASAVLDAAK